MLVSFQSWENLSEMALAFFFWLFFWKSVYFIEYLESNTNNDCTGEIGDSAERALWVLHSEAIYLFFSVQVKEA